MALIARGPRAAVGIRVVIGLGVVLAGGLLVFEMSGSAPRTAGSDHVGPDTFSVILPAGGTVCQPIEPIPDDAARASVLIGTYYRPAPAIALRFADQTGQVVAQGSLPPGAHQGYIMVPLHRVPRAAPAVAACLHVGGTGHYAIGGQKTPVTLGSAVLNGQRQPATISIFYYRRGSESWWDLLPTLDQRFSLGKATFFGPWTLPVMALLVLLVWIGALRLLRSELT